jgi:hypothetical protein
MAGVRARADVRLPQSQVPAALSAAVARSWQEQVQRAFDRARCRGSPSGNASGAPSYSGG